MLGVTTPYDAVAGLKAAHGTLAFIDSYFLGKTKFVNSATISIADI
jgi:hypothetical protein